jgi:hypothetical protein
VQRADVVRLDRQRRVEARERLVVAAERNERQTKIVECVRPPRFDLERRQIAGAGIVVPFERAQRVAAIVEHVGVVRLCHQRRFTALQGLLGTAEHQQRHAAVAQHLGVSSIERESRIVAGKRFLRAFQCGKRVAFAVERRDMMRLQRQHLLVVGKRLRMARHRGKRRTPIVERVDMTGREHQRPIIACQSLGMALEMPERIAPIVMERRAIPGPHRQRLVEAGKRFLVALESVKNDAVVGQHIGRRRPHLQRGRNQPQGVGRAALLMLEHAAEMERIEIDRIGIENSVVDLPRLGQPPLPMQGERLLDGRRSRSKSSRTCLPFRAQSQAPQSPLAGPASGKVGQDG